MGAKFLCEYHYQAGHYFFFPLLRGVLVSRTLYADYLARFYMFWNCTATFCCTSIYSHACLIIIDQEQMGMWSIEVLTLTWLICSQGAGTSLQHYYKTDGYKSISLSKKIVCINLHLWNMETRYGYNAYIVM